MSITIAGLVRQEIYMKQFQINHPSDLSDAHSELKDLRFPYRLMANSTVATKAHGTEYEKRQRLMAYFHRSVVPTYAECAGLSEPQAKAELQAKLDRVGESMEDESGEFDVVWIDGDRFFTFEQGKKVIVRSVAGLSNSELSSLINKCKDYILMQYGVAVPEIDYNIKTKII